MSQTIELLKNVPITNTILGLETLLTELCESVAFNLDESKQIYIDSLTITGEPTLAGINALTLGGQGIDYFSPSTHNHDSDYLAIEGTAVDSVLLNNQNGAYYLNWNNFTNTPETYDPSSHTHDVSDLSDLDTYLNSVTASKTATEGQTAFSLSAEWPDSYYSLAVFRNGIYQLQGSDFSINTGTKTITFEDPCTVGEDIVVIFNTKLNIDVVDAHYHDDRYLQLTGGALTGELIITGTSRASGKLYAGSSAPSNTARLNYDGYFYASRVYNAVYNDLAECFIPDGNINYEEVKNRIVQIINGKVSLSNPSSYTSVGVVSDNYAFLIGGSEEEILNNEKIPIGLVGTLWVDSYHPVDNNYLGYFIYSGNDGKALVVTDFDYLCNYHGKIVGKIIDFSEVKNQYKVLLCIK